MSKEDTPFTINGFQRILGTEDKRPNIITKDAPIVLITQEITRVWGSCEPKTWKKTKKYIYFKSWYHSDVFHLWAFI